ncbi:MAG: PF20097 family protein [Thermoplasmata archaeon]
MAESTCAACGGALENGYVTTTNGSGLFWAHDSTAARLRPKGLEVLVGTRFGGTYSANVPGARCPQCRTILLRLPTSSK